MERRNTRAPSSGYSHLVHTSEHLDKESVSPNTGRQSRARIKVAPEICDQLIQRRRESWTTRKDNLDFAGAGAFREPTRNTLARFNGPAKLRQIGSVQKHLTGDPRIVHESVHGVTLAQTRGTCAQVRS